MWGFGVKAKTTVKNYHLWITVLNIAGVNNGSNQLNNAKKITSDKMVGVFAGNMIFMLSVNESLINNASYITPIEITQKTRHVIGDLLAGCYVVSGSKDGKIGEFTTKDKENSIVFNVASTGIQTITITANCVKNNSTLNNITNNTIINKCANVNCSYPNGVCDSNTGNCSCVVSYSGKNCEIYNIVDKCNGKNCSLHGLCDPNNGFYIFLISFHFIQ